MENTIIGNPVGTIILVRIGSVLWNHGKYCFFLHDILPQRYVRCISRLCIFSKLFWELGNWWEGRNMCLLQYCSTYSMYRIVWVYLRFCDISDILLLQFQLVLQILISVGQIFSKYRKYSYLFAPTWAR